MQLTIPQFGPLCIGVAQTPPADGSLSEDCLTANVFTPSNTTTDSKLPVWVFIQGGGYATLGPFFNGTEVVQASRGGIVFVNFNYRVGVLGFLASEAIREDGDLNAGLLDQRKLLQWVQDHIAQVRPHRDSCSRHRFVIQKINMTMASLAAIQLA